MKKEGLLLVERGEELEEGRVLGEGTWREEGDVLVLHLTIKYTIQYVIYTSLELFDSTMIQ